MGEKRVAESWGFAKQVVEGRWFSVFASFVIMIGASSPYLFGTYSEVIKTQFNYSQTQVNTLGFAKDLGSNLGVFAGFLAEVAPPWVLFIVGSSLNFFSFIMIWLSVTHQIAMPQFWQMFLYICLATNAQNFANTAVMVISVENFPDRRGIILGLLKGFIGLGGAVLTQIYLAIYGDEDASDVLLLLAWFPSIMSMMLLSSIRTIKARKHLEDLKVFYHLLYASIILAAFIFILTLTQKHIVFSHAGYVGGVVVVIALLCLPLLIAVKEEFLLFKLKKHNVDQSVTLSINEEKPLLSSSVLGNLKMSSTVEESSLSKPERGEDFTILQALLSKDMALIFLATITACGSSIAAINNLGQIAESLDYPAESISVFISWISISNFFGRVFSGFISETLMTKYKLPRPLMFALAHLLTCIGILFIAFPYRGSVYVASLIIGFGFGAQVPLLFAIIPDLFGLKHYSMLLNCGQLAVPFGSYILNVLLIGKLYDMEATKTGNTKNGKGLTCKGAHCFSGSFTILAVVTLFGAMGSLALAYRTRNFYKGDIYKRYKDDMWTTQSNMELNSLDTKNSSEQKKTTDDGSK